MGGVREGQCCDGSSHAIEITYGGILVGHRFFTAFTFVAPGTSVSVEHVEAAIEALAWVSETTTNT